MNRKEKSNGEGTGKITTIRYKHSKGEQELLMNRKKINEA